jgi:hypothetical protein
MIPAIYRDWCNELQDQAGFPCPAPSVTRRASHWSGGIRGMCRGPTSGNGYRYSRLEITCGLVTALHDQDVLEIPVPGAGSLLFEVERTVGYVQTPGYTTLDLVAAVDQGDVADALATALRLSDAVTSGRLRLFRTLASVAIQLVARDPFVANRHGVTATAGGAFTESWRFGAQGGNKDGWKVVRCGPHRRFVRCLTQSERLALRPQ